jgi:hypothetical protein
MVLRNYNERLSVVRTHAYSFRRVKFRLAVKFFDRFDLSVPIPDPRRVASYIILNQVKTLDFEKFDLLRRLLLWENEATVFFRCSRSSVNEEYLMGPSTSVCLSRFSRGFSTCMTGGLLFLRVYSTDMTSDENARWTVTQQWPRVTSVQQRPTWRGVKNFFEMPVYSKEYTFPVVLFWGLK